MFRRIADQLKNPDWPTVTLEFILVVTGIFLALQADNWNEKRKDEADARLFVERMHREILLAEELTKRLRERRLAVRQSLIEAAATLFDRNGPAELTDTQCFAIGASAFFNINISEFPALGELIATGRMAIVADDELRASLVALQQVKATLERLLMTHLATAKNLASNYPQLIAAENYVEPDTGEVRIRYSCDVQKMRSDYAFLNELALNVDTYDVYVRDGLAPWFEQFDRAHRRVDEALQIEHGR
ncbi:MAG: hypothetical protein OES09_18295 [Gammaproteobacteria bacterium]|nr:hypothetical protein [Gammaproteobacteria bacterium]